MCPNILWPSKMISLHMLGLTWVTNWGSKTGDVKVAGLWIYKTENLWWYQIIELLSLLSSYKDLCIFRMFHTCRIVFSQIGTLLWKRLVESGMFLEKLMSQGLLYIV